MSKVEDFLSSAEEKSVIDAIVLAEKNTSGEIRIHLEKKSDKAPFDRAIEVFNKLEMYKTKDRNGVLIYVAVKDKKFVICGDDEINKKVASDFWESTKEAIQNQFRNGNFAQGLIDGITKAGEQLKIYFPYNNDDTNELSNEISTE